MWYVLQDTSHTTYHTTYRTTHDTTYLSAGGVKTSFTMLRFILGHTPDSWCCSPDRRRYRERERDRKKDSITLCVSWRVCPETLSCGGPLFLVFLLAKKQLYNCRHVLQLCDSAKNEQRYIDTGAQSGGLRLYVAKGNPYEEVVPNWPALRLQADNLMYSYV